VATAFGALGDNDVGASLDRAHSLGHVWAEVQRCGKPLLV
jgi:hypothetical protein